MTRNNLARLEKTMYENIFLKDFWPLGTIGHTDEFDQDITREFLVDLASKLVNKKNVPILISSHFESVSKFKSLITRIAGLIKRFHETELQRRKRLHNHIDPTLFSFEHFRQMWYTSENRRPPLDQKWNAFLSHDIDHFDGRNIYLPIWSTRLGANLAAANKVQQIMLNSREVKAVPPFFACAVISNPEPIRMAFIMELQQIGKVDIYGAFGLPLASKREMISRYRFNICFENDAYPGYVTEKPFEAWQASSIPIWRGEDRGRYLNPLSIINVGQLGFAGAVSRVLELEESESKYLEVASQNILSKEFDFNNVLLELQKLMD